MLAESANRTKKLGQDLIGGLDVCVDRNHFGRQAESFEALLDLPFLGSPDSSPAPFNGVFIRAPVVKQILGPQSDTSLAIGDQDMVHAPASKRDVGDQPADEAVRIMGRLPTGSGRRNDIVAVQQDNCFGTSFHPELTNDPRIHAWWLKQVEKALRAT